MVTRITSRSENLVRRIEQKNIYVSKMNVRVPTLEDICMKQVISLATPEHLLELIGERVDDLIIELVSTPTGKARLLDVVSKKATYCETHFSEYNSMKMDMTTTKGDCEKMRDTKTGIQFTWCPHWGGAGSGYFLDVQKDDAFQKKGMDLGFERSIFSIVVRPNPMHKKLLLELCESEGMDQGALFCLNLLLEKRWFSEFNENNKRQRVL